jgi:hypothetical protein
MATVGALIGGYVTYRLAEKGGEETLEKKVGERRAEKVYRRFKQHGFATVAVGAMLPPPFPIVPFLIAAGALKYPRRNFLAALGLGRAASLWIRNHRMGVALLPPAALHLDNSSRCGWNCRAGLLEMVPAKAYAEVATRKRHGDSPSLRDSCQKKTRPLKAGTQFYRRLTNGNLRKPPSPDVQFKFQENDMPGTTALKELASI